MLQPLYRSVLVLQLQHLRLKLLHFGIHDRETFVFELALQLENLLLRYHIAYKVFPLVDFRPDSQLAMLSQLWN